MASNVSLLDPVDPLSSLVRPPSVPSLHGIFLDQYPIRLLIRSNTSADTDGAAIGEGSSSSNRTRNGPWRTFPAVLTVTTRMVIVTQSVSNDTLTEEGDRLEQHVSSSPLFSASLETFSGSVVVDADAETGMRGSFGIAFSGTTSRTHASLNDSVLMGQTEDLQERREICRLLVAVAQFRRLAVSLDLTPSTPLESREQFKVDQRIENVGELLRGLFLRNTSVEGEVQLDRFTYEGQVLEQAHALLRALEAVAAANDLHHEKEMPRLVLRMIAASLSAHRNPYSDRQFKVLVQACNNLKRWLVDSLKEAKMSGNDQLFLSLRDAVPVFRQSLTEIDAMIRPDALEDVKFATRGVVKALKDCSESSQDQLEKRSAIMQERNRDLHRVMVRAEISIDDLDLRQKWRESRRVLMHASCSVLADMSQPKTDPTRHQDLTAGLRNVLQISQQTFGQPGFWTPKPREHASSFIFVWQRFL